MAKKEAPESRVGTVLNNRYRITRRIASGGMGVVYKGERLELGRPVAIKFLHPSFVDNSRFIARFEREAKAMSSLDHPFCVSVIDFGIDISPYIVMDYVTGRTLKDLLAEGRLDISRTMRIAGQLLSALAHAHGRNIIHRDIKPENIMLAKAKGLGEHVRIFDFGLAKLLDSASDPGVSVSALVIGTPKYMSPEQTLGGEVDGRSDLYSTAVVMYEMLTGQKLFADPDVLKLLSMHREQRPSTLGEADPKIPFSPKLEALIAKALEKAPEDRFQTAEEFIEALNETPEMEHTLATSKAAEKPSELHTTKRMPALELDDDEIAAEREARKAAANTPSKEEEEPSSTAEVAREPSTQSALEYLARRRNLVLAASGFAVVAILFIWLALGSDTPTDDSEAQGEADKGSSAQPDGDKTEVARSERGERTKKTKGKSPSGASEKAEADDKGNKDKSDSAEKEPPRPVENLDDVKALIAEGRREAAIAGLNKLRRQSPKNAQYPYYLGKLYFEKLWWSDAMDHYREAIRLNGAFRNRKSITHDLIEALGSEKTSRKAHSILRNDVGRAALPQLRRAAKQNQSARVRKRAAILVRQLS